jgi:hypothetical protein
VMSHASASKLTVWGVELMTSTTTGDPRDAGGVTTRNSGRSRRAPEGDWQPAIMPSAKIPATMPERLPINGRTDMRLHDTRIAEGVAHNSSKGSPSRAWVILNPNLTRLQWDTNFLNAGVTGNQLPPVRGRLLDPERTA